MPKVEHQVGRAKSGTGGGAVSSPLTLDLVQGEELLGTGAEGVLVGPVAVGGGEDVAGGDEDPATVREHSSVWRETGGTVRSGKLWWTENEFWW